MAARFDSTEEEEWPLLLERDESNKKNRVRKGKRLECYYYRRLLFLTSEGAEVGSMVVSPTVGALVVTLGASVMRGDGAAVGADVILV